MFGIRLTRTPASALAGLLRSSQTPTASGLDVLSVVSGVRQRDLAAIVTRERVVTAADADELAAIATAAGAAPSSLSYGLVMERACDDDERMGMHEDDENMGMGGDKDEDKDMDEEDDKPFAPFRARFVMSTAAPDRARDIVGQTWRLDSFRANPVAPWGHRSDMPPVGVWEDVGVRGGRLMGTLVAHPIASYDLSMTVAEQLRRGILSAVSVGFLPGAAIRRSDMDEADPRYGQRGMFFDKNELLECSPVTVPMNAGALTEPPMSPDEQQRTAHWLTAPPRTGATFL